jgi:hypothetical protein
MPRFMPPANRPVSPMGYHQVPADIIEDDESLVSWARKSVGVAMASQVRKAKRPMPGAPPKAKGSKRKAEKRRRPGRSR